MGRVKVCGVTRLVDAQLVAESGADALGWNLWPESPRCVTLDGAVAIAEAVRDRLKSVAVTVNMPGDDARMMMRRLQPDYIQCHGEESAQALQRLGPRAYKAIRLGSELDVELACRVPGPLALVDARDAKLRGGTGHMVPWDLAARVCEHRPTLLAGGLGPDNVAAAIRACRPWGVDAASRLEHEPGHKDAAKVQQFVAAARAAFAHVEDLER